MRLPWWIWTQTAGIIIGFALYFSVPAHADLATDYADVSWDSVCSTLDDFPTLVGVLGVGQGIVNDSGMSYPQAGEVIGYSVATYCPRHTGLLNRFVAVYGNKGQLV